ncbi:uncharacterized mitochondrial protein AtMg01250-like [Rutidosis leptorrhynchoides]|uniref:uncharacterized mitochondrial protein AtMg01250-like n=1 Tax=Rutidosis leptorrhynchoides TaxID=125765 RepID=UPI003A98EA3A
MLREIMLWCKKKNQKSLLFKVDFEKAFDSVIKGCLSSARTSVSVNGNPTREFPIKRGLLQGDSVSPFLFIIVMEGLHLEFHRVIELDFIRGIKVGNSNMRLSHFIYADDVILSD